MLNQKKKISSEELSGFCSQTALILNAGIALYDGLETLAETYKESPNAEMYKRLAEKVSETGNMYEAMQADEEWPVYLTEMVGIGEQTGRLEDVMNGLAEYYRREYRIRSTVKSAVAYPITLAIMLVIIVLVMLIKVLPVFRRVLAGMGAGLSGNGARLMAVGTFAGWLVLVIMAILILGAAACLVLLKSKKKEMVMDFIKRVFPPIVKLQKEITASRVASVLAMMLSSGFPIQEALQMTPMVLSDEKSAEKMKKLAQQVEEGEGFADSLEKTDIFDRMHARMVRMGVAAGREDTVMQQIADIYEERMETQISSLIAIIEPTMVTLLAIVIGAILLSVTMPMAGILSSMF